MRTALINASPKTGDSSSRTLLGKLEEKLGADTEWVELHKASLTDGQTEALLGCEVWVFAFPVYIDALPSHLLGCLCQLEECLAGRESENAVRVYAVANCGFYEGSQTVPALAVMKNWCARAGVEWGMGVGFGGGGGLEYMQGVPTGKGPLASLGKCLNELSSAISGGRSGESLTASINFPRFLYRLGAENTWKNRCRENGIDPAEMDRQM